MDKTVLSGVVRRRRGWHRVFVVVLAIGCFAAPGVGRGAEPVDISSWRGCQPGPWGKLEKRSVTFTIAGDRFPVELCEPRPSRWVLPARTPDELAKILTGVGLAATDVDQLVTATSTRTSAGGAVVHPTDDLIARLSRSTRSQLYALLGRAPSNERQHLPYQFTAVQFEARLKQAPIASEIKDLVRSLAYDGRRSVLFADSDLVLRRIRDPAERRRFIELLTQFNSYQVRLVLDETSDIESVSRYWGNTGHLVSFLSGLSSATAHVGIIELLSPFAKMRLNTYPVRNPRRPVAGPDCFWTAANYFSDVPDDAFFNPEVVTAYIQAQYKHVLTPTYGDVALFVDKPQRTPVHAAIFLADDLMFTKNGYHYWTPWTINSVLELVDCYGVHADVEIHYFRMSTK